MSEEPCQHHKSYWLSQFMIMNVKIYRYVFSNYVDIRHERSKIRIEIFLVKYSNIRLPTIHQWLMFVYIKLVLISIFVEENYTIIWFNFDWNNISKRKNKCRIFLASWLCNFFFTETFCTNFFPEAQLKRGLVSIYVIKFSIVKSSKKHKCILFAVKSFF